MNIRFKFINGKWVNDDLELIPTIKLRIGSKANKEKTAKATATIICLCWLKWGLAIMLGKVKPLSPDEVIKSDK